MCCRHRSCVPDCQLYAVDMAFCGGEGLVTSKSNATFIMICQRVSHFLTHADLHGACMR